jgi:hypothetical protein
MQRSGFEWLYRFLQEPRRMFKRYFIDSLGFFVIFGREFWSTRMRPRLPFLPHVILITTTAALVLMQEA